MRALRPVKPAKVAKPSDDGPVIQVKDETPIPQIKLPESSVPDLSDPSEQ